MVWQRWATSIRCAGVWRSGGETRPALTSSCRRVESVEGGRWRGVTCSEESSIWAMASGGGRPTYCLMSALQVCGRVQGKGGTHRSTKARSMLPVRLEVARTRTLGNLLMVSIWVCGGR